MARPGDSEFEWSDFDFSDEDFETLEREEDYSVEDDLPADDPADETESAAATRDRGKYKCDVCDRAYKTTTWLAKHKSKEHPDSTEPQPGTSSSSEEQRTTDKEASTTTKSTKSKRKLKVKRPKSKFEETDAQQAVPELLTEALQQASKYQPWQVKVGSLDTPGNKAARIAAELVDVWTNVDPTSFIATLCTLLWSVIAAGNTSLLCSVGDEAMYRAFDRLRSGEVFHSLWNNFMTSLGKTPCPVFYQFITWQVFEGLVTKKLNVDVPCSASASSPDDTAMTNEEEQVLRYVAGYIPHALLKHYQKYDNKLAKLYVALLSQWKVTGIDQSHKSFLKYTEEWVNTVNRGGLFIVTDQVYLFFRAVEKVVRSTANIQQLQQGRLTGMKDEIIKKLERDFMVNHYWCKLARDIPDEKASVALLEKVLLYFVNLRCRAFADAYILVRRQKDNAAASKKGEKSLRKSLNP